MPSIIEKYNNEIEKVIFSIKPLVELEFQLLMRTVKIMGTGTYKKISGLKVPANTAAAIVLDRKEGIWLSGWKIRYMIPFACFVRLRIYALKRVLLFIQSSLGRRPYACF